MLWSRPRARFNATRSVKDNLLDAQGLQLQLRGETV